MSEPMTQQFVTAFLTTCFDAGLSKEAASSLLQKESADRALAISAPWTEGYLSVAEQVPGNLRPMLFKEGSAGLEKAAINSSVLKGLGTAGKALLWDLPKGLLTAGGGVAKGVGEAAKSVYGPSSSSFLHRFPLATTLGTTALGGAGAVGAYHLLNQDRGLMGVSGESDPFFGPGGYDPATYKERYDSKLYDDYGPGIFEHNKEWAGTAARRRELAEAIRQNKGGGQAYRELNELNRRHAQLTRQRDDYYNRIGGAQSSNRELTDRIAQRQRSLENQRGAWWAAPKRWWLSATGRNPQQYFDEQVGRLEDSAMRARMQTDLLGDRRRLLDAGATARHATTPPSSREIQQNFFPTY